MKIALIQSSLIWENPKANRNHFEEKINAITEKVDLIVLPEMFSTGFTMNPEIVFETMEGETIQWLQSIAKAKNSAITGSLVIKENNNFYNRLVFVFPSGEIEVFDKRHLFSLAYENECYTSGNHKLIVDYKGWKICPLICYDLRFPVFSRNTKNYDVLLYVANWPKARINAWDILLKARSVENICYTIGVNRVGFDDNNFEYNGHSQAVDFLGNYLLEPQENEGAFIVELNKQALEKTRNKLGFLNDRDSFELVSN
ncbi:amidohydrolase [Flavobacterium cellulosilyticum]|uniref:Omega-amidase YafV n=1 Tax=Flavobacterium cellulosilyticum TaxID=2541731 RepID=A0A4R5CJ61_9FLAO|nr:amidohydrolase [Flavobacterium cellulosilyticum]TDD99855.1 amidohydrolase [Flavobacterium cellulosilyticum]